MPSTTYTGTVFSGAAVIYGASATPAATVAFSSTYDSAASLSIVTTAVNTKWLVEVDADIDTASNIAFTTGLYLKAKVDGSYVATAGARWGASASLERELTLRGRAVVTLAATGAHTILAAAYNPSADSRASVTLTAIAISATQLTG